MHDENSAAQVIEFVDVYGLNPNHVRQADSNNTIRNMITPRMKRSDRLEEHILLIFSKEGTTEKRRKQVKRYNMQRIKVE